MPWRLVLSAILVAAALAARPAAALDPQRSITQYMHRVWTVGSNGLGSAPMSITQSPDGYLLFGAQDGIYRFNGEQFQRWQPRASTSRSVRFVNDMHFARDGSLYLSLRDGLARYRDGRLFFFKEQLVEPPIFEDDRGRIWLGSRGWQGEHNQICYVDGDRVICKGSADGAPCSFGLWAAPDPHGGVLSFSKEGVCRLSKTGQQSRLDYPDRRSIRYARAVWDRAGHVYALLRNSTEQSLLETDGLRWKPVPASEKISDGRSLFRDRQGALWIGTWRSGLWRIINGKAEHYTRADGLSGNNVAAIFEDRDGSVWISTTEGIDQFRASPVVRFGQREGLSGDRPANLFVTRSGELWVANVFGVDAFRDGRLLTPAPNASSRRDVLSLVQDSDGRTWSLIGGVGIFYENERRPVRNDLNVPLADPQDLSATPDGNVWTGNIYKDRATPRGALVQMQAGRVVAEFPTPPSVDRSVIYKLAPDGKDGLWVAVLDHGALLFRDGRFTPLPLPASTNVVGIAPIIPGSAWMATMDGLFHVTTQGTTRRLGVAQGLPCEAFPAVTVASTGDLWLKSDCGLLHIAKRELDRFLENKSARIHAEIFDATDGAPIDEYSNQPYETPDGKIWFSNFSGLFMVDTRAFSGPKQPVTAFIENIMADGRSFISTDGRRSPTRPRRIEISFSGVDFDRPDRVTFRYELTRGRQRWHGETTERTASFTDLGPGRYRFTVVACENGLRCSVRPATLTFEIPPTFAQTWMFKVAMAFVAAFLAWGGYRTWLRQVTLNIQRRTEARLGERERIARDLHDTLLQGFQGLLLRIQGVANNIPREDPLRTGLENALNRGEQIIVEGRDRVRELRVDENGLPEVLRKFIDDASLDCDVDIELEIKGFPRDLRRGVATEVGQIAREALSNACRHAQASRILLTIEFGLPQLNVRIADDGNGLNTRASEADTTPHFGLSGMRERAERLKASLVIESAPGLGTEVSLSLSSNVAYVPKSSVAADVVGRLGDWLSQTRDRFLRRSSNAENSI
jgi:ligand-binding sensor domain-containing protein/signal transduction histidine kinase